MSKRKKKKYADPSSTKLKQGSENSEGSQEDSADDSTSTPGADSGGQKTDSAPTDPSAPEDANSEPQPKKAKGKLQIFAKKEDEPGVETYKRPLWKHLLRYAVVSTILLLNVGMVGSLVERSGHGQSMDIFKELFFFAFAGIVNLLFGVPAVFEVNRARVDDESLELNTLLWRTRLKWGEVLEFEQPRFLKFAILRTRRCFYLINRRDIIAFDSLARSIMDKMASTRR